MARRSWPLLVVLLLAVCSLATAAGPELAGNWKMVVTLDPDKPPQALWIISFEGKDGKWTGKVIAKGEGVKPVTFDDLSVADDKISFNLKTPERTFSFEGTIPKEAGGRIRGNALIGRTPSLAVLEPTKLTDLSPLELNKEVLAGPANDVSYFDTGLSLLQDATDNKAKLEEVRSWAEKLFKAAEVYGPRWQRDISMRMANALSPQASYAELAVNYARRAERLTDPKASPLVQYRVQVTLANALKKAGKTAEAQEIEARLEKIDIGVKPEKFAGRKGKGDRTVLLEVFEGTSCKPCVAAALAASAVIKTYKPTDVVVLEYHLHNAGANPLTNPETEKRQDYYGKAAEATPAVFISGARVEGVGGTFEDGDIEYREYRRLLETAMEKEAGAQIKLAAVRKGNKLNISAEVSGLAKPGEQVKLRLALVEEEVRFVGGNGLRVHHHVVRGMPGGPDGFALTKKADKQEIRVDLDDLRKGLTKYLDDLGKKNDITFPVRPMEFKDLKVVAFVQNDDTAEILQAAQVDVRTDKE